MVELRCFGENPIYLQAGWPLAKVSALSEQHTSPVARIALAPVETPQPAPACCHAVTAIHTRPNESPTDVRTPDTKSPTSPDKVHNNNVSEPGPLAQGDDPSKDQPRYTPADTRFVPVVPSANSV